MELQDKIGREEIVNKICGLADSLQKDQNFCLSLNGAWGSGKSFVLQLIEEHLSQYPEYIIVKYDAWENTFYHDPLIAMLYCILDSLNCSIPFKNAIIQGAKKAGEEAVNIVAEHTQVGKFIKSAIKIIKSIIRTYKKTVLTNNAKVEKYKSYAAFLKETIDKLNEITSQELCKDRQTKLIVFVDEIDRCLPDEQLKILERVHHLFKVKNCAVIVAMNQPSVCKTVHALYGVDGNEYLRKFFDFTYKLETSANDYLGNLFKSFKDNIKKLNDSGEQLELSIDLAYLCLLHGTKRVLDEVDNRELSRYYEVMLLICNDFGWEKLTPKYIFFILIGLYIRKDISSTFLNEQEIRNIQKSINAARAIPGVARDSMPYSDYLVEYLGFDRHQLPNGIGMLGNDVIEFSWVFNEIVFYSIDKQTYPEKEMGYPIQPKVDSAICKELRRLIINYGGDQEINATNER